MPIAICLIIFMAHVIISLWLSYYRVIINKVKIIVLIMEVTPIILIDEPRIVIVF